MSKKNIYNKEIKNQNKNQNKNKNMKTGKSNRYKIKKVEIFKSYDELTNIEFKRNFKRDLVVILTVIFISLIFGFFNFNNKKIININSKNVKEIVLINCFSKDSVKRMIISKSKDIEDLCNKLNSIKKVPKKEIIDNALSTDKKIEINIDNDINMILEIDYKNQKKKDEIIKIKGNHISVNDKNYQIKENNIQNIWYTFNEKVESLTIEELEKYNYN